MGIVTMNQLGEVDLELVIVSRRVRTLDLTQLALEAGIHDRPGFRSRYLRDVTVVLVVEKREETRERVAILEAKPAAMTDLEDARDFFLERFGIPVDGLAGGVRESVGGQIRNACRFGHVCSW